MLIDDEGNVLQGATFMTNEQHLPRGDDAFFLGNGAAWMTGNAAAKELQLHLVDSSLHYRCVILK